MNKGLSQIIMYLVGCVLLLSSCDNHGEEYHSITDKIEAESKNYHGTSVSSEEYIDGIKTMEVTENGRTFFIPERRDEISSYACTECHTKPLADMNSIGLKKAHWDIKLDHANLKTMNCITCHNGDDMDHLKSLTDTKIDFNSSYILCSQCHTKQFKDWTGGAHGKQMGGWAPPRTAMTCVNCHNPHKPYFQSKWPARYNTQKVDERK